MTLQEMRERRANLFDQRAALNKKAEDEHRDLTEEEDKQWVAWGAEGDALSKAIEEAEIDQRREYRQHEIAREQAELAAPRKPLIGPSASAPRVEIGNPALLNDPRRGFGNMGEFGMAVYRACSPEHAVDRRLMMLTAGPTGAGQAIGSEGGFLVPPEFSTAIWEGLAKQPDNILARTDNYTVSGESITFNANAETSRATGSRWGGIRGYWVAEANQITASKPKLRQVKIEPKQLAVLVYATDKLLRNGGPAVSQFLTRAATEEITFMSNDAIINGTGAGQPLGLLNGVSADTALNTPATGTAIAGGMIAQYKEVGQAAKTVIPQNIVRMWSRLHNRSRGTAIWLINQEIEPQLYLMNQQIGAGGVLVYMPPGGLSDAPYGTLFGRPVIPCDYCAALGTQGDVILMDPAAYVTGTRGTVETAMSIHLRFDYAESVFRFMYEVDGQPWLAAPLTPYKGNNTLSAYVTLVTRS